jgi:hypothetical protein
LRKSTLPLFMAWIFANHADNVFAFDHSAAFTKPLY